MRINKVIDINCFEEFKCISHIKSTHVTTRDTSEDLAVCCKDYQQSNSPLVWFVALYSLAFKGTWNSITRMNHDLCIFTCVSLPTEGLSSLLACHPGLNWNKDSFVLSDAVRLLPVFPSCVSSHCLWPPVGPEFCLWPAVRSASLSGPVMTIIMLLSL